MIDPDGVLMGVLMEGSTLDCLSVAVRAIGVAPATAPPAERRLGTPRRV